MDKTSLILSGLLSLALVIMIAPGIFARNKGNVLRNIALWVAIFFGLALIYKHFGPFQTAYDAPAAAQADGQIMPTTDLMMPKNDDVMPSAPDLNNNYTPPSEEQ